MATRKVLFGALAALLAALPASAQPPGPSGPPAAAPADLLPPRPVPVLGAEAAPRPLGPPGPPLYTPPPPSPPPLPEPPLDGFTTRIWADADYLLWWIKDSHLPPLVTAGSSADLVPGALGQPGTQVLLGGDVNNEARSGGRFRAGYWLTPDQTFGLDGSFFFLANRSVRFGVASGGVPVLARPFYNVNTDQEDANVVAFPGQQAGAVSAALSSNLLGAEANLRGMLFRGPSYQLSLLGGFRFLDLDESLRMKEMDAFAADIASPAVWTTAVDRIRTSNQFYGGQLGTDLTVTYGRLFVNALGKVALGVSNETTRIRGWSGYTNSLGQSGSAGFGVLALPTNLGSYGQDTFAVVPEGAVNVGYIIGPHLRVSVGYTFLYWSSVFRPGDQIDRAVNTTQVPASLGGGAMAGPARPNFLWRDTDFWAQGLNFGMELRY